MQRIHDTQGRPRRLRQLASAVFAVGLGAGVATVNAANHREAPLTALDHKADITDVFAFVSYDDPGKVTLIVNVDPLLEPANGPNYFPFDPEILYEIKVDNDHDAREDITFQFRFHTTQRLPGVFTSFVGALDGLVAPPDSPAPVPAGTVVVPPAITALDGPGSEGLGTRQTYSVSVKRGDSRQAASEVIARGLIALPSNVGPRTMPDYASLYEQAIHPIGNGIQVFAGTVDDPFSIDLGAAFDTLNFRPGASGAGLGGVLTAEQDAADDVNFSADDVSGYNVNAIAIEVPVEMLTSDGAAHTADEPAATIGVWATTSRPRVKVRSTRPGRPGITSRSMVQVQRMANPLFNELLIGTGSKDKFSMSHPKNDAEFAAFALDPLLARALNAAVFRLTGTDALPIPTPPRTDLLPLVQYLPPIAAPGTPTGPVADLLRLNTGILPTPPEARSRLGLLTLLDADSSNDDAAGFPNGRRPSDDVVDIATRAVVGVLKVLEDGDASFSGFPHNALGDGVNTNDVPYRDTFPYLSLAHSGRNSGHVDPGEAGCVATSSPQTPIECPIE